MNNGGKQRQPRSSWWSSSEAATSWLGAVRERFAKRTSGAKATGVRFGVKQTKTNEL